MKKIFLLISLFLLSNNLLAGFIASNVQKINPNYPTHILIAGYPENLGEMFVYSLITKANIYLEKSSVEQVIIIGRGDDEQIIKKSGFKILSSKSGLLKPELIKTAIKDVKKISSIDIFAHSNALSGASLDSNSWVYQLLNEKDDLWDDVAKKVNNSSFIFIHGCNAGIKLAPNLARKLKIAVWAALTSTDFQYLYGNENENENEKFWSFDYNANINKKSSTNNLSFTTPKSCSKNCTRMKPDNSSYKGHWGNWSAGGYPAYKLFCGSNTNVTCELGALEALYSFPSTHQYLVNKSNLNNFKKQLIDFMCPFAYDVKKQNICQMNLENSLESTIPSPYSPFKGKTLVCDRIQCKAHFNCSSLNAAFNPGNCSLETESETDEDSFTFTEEYKYLIEIYKKNNNNEINN